MSETFILTATCESSHFVATLNKIDSNHNVIHLHGLDEILYPGDTINIDLSFYYDGEDLILNGRKEVSHE